MEAAILHKSSGKAARMCEGSWCPCAWKKSSLGTGDSSCQIPFECSGNIQEASYLILMIALRVRYDYLHSPEEEQEAQRGVRGSQGE